MPKRSLFILVLPALLIPIAVYLRVWDYYAVNIAKWDDHALKQTLIDYLNATSLWDTVRLLSSQHNEHRIFLTRLFTILDYSYFGQLDYKRLMFVGNILLLLVIVVWWRLLKHNGKTLLSLIPVALLWPTLAHWENMYWGMASIQNFGVVTLVVVALYWCLKGPWGYFAGGLIIGTLTAYSSGNGIIALPLAGALLLLSRQKTKGFITLGVGALVLILYFSTYTKPDYNPEARAGIWLLLKGFMAFLGSFAEAFPVKGRQDTSVIFGVILFLVCASIISTTLFRLLRDQYKERYLKITDAFCLGVMLFILVTAAVVVWGRAGYGIEGLLTSRYKIYSFLLLITAYLFIVIPIRGSFYHPYVTGVATLCLVFNIFSYHYHVVDAYNLRKFMITTYFNNVYDNKELNPFSADTTVQSLVARPSLFYERWLPLLPGVSAEKPAGHFTEAERIIKDTRISTSKTNILVANDSYQSQRLQDSGVYLLLSSAERYYLVPTFRSRNTSRKQLLFRQQYFAPGFGSDHSFDQLNLLPGRYGYGLVLQRGDDTGIVMSEDSLIVPQYAKKNPVKTNW